MPGGKKKKERSERGGRTQERKEGSWERTHHALIKEEKEPKESWQKAHDQREAYNLKHKMNSNQQLTITKGEKQSVVNQGLTARAKDTGAEKKEPC